MGIFGGDGGRFRLKLLELLVVLLLLRYSKNRTVMKKNEIDRSWLFSSKGKLCLKRE